MNSNILLPCITAINITGFDTLFKEPIDKKILKGPFLVLGGNGIGKTTILQAIVFGLIGGADSEIENDVKLRWDHDYFIKRLDSNQNSEIQISFILGSTTISLRRGIKTNNLLAIKIDKNEWEENSKSASEIYKNIIIQSGGYQNFSDFRFLIYRLCYLRESRPSLVWDYRAQIRATMLICSDADSENRFRQFNKKFRDIDTKKRHLNVDIGNLSKKINDYPESNQSINNVKNDIKKNNSQQISDLYKKINNIKENRIQLLTELRDLESSIQKINNRLENLHEKLSEAEGLFIFKALKELENESLAISLQKILIYHTCPYCSQKSEKLFNSATLSISQGNCPICNEVHSINNSNNIDISEARNEISDLTKDRMHSEKKYSRIQELLADLNAKEYQIRIQIEKLNKKLPMPQQNYISKNISDINLLKSTLSEAKNQYASLEILWTDLKSTVDKLFDDFTISSSDRLQKFQQIASEYGKQFLGQDCEFIPVPVKEKSEIGEFRFFVPKFDGKERGTPDSCSESERFFLDIAFRLALLELTGILSKSFPTFICETPENALDLAYVENVSSMFKQFAEKQFSLILSINIQSQGIAKYLLQKYPKEQKIKRMINLIDIGYLSNVQEEKLEMFEDELQKLLDY